MNQTYLAIAMLVLSGVFLSLQAPINATLGRTLDNGVLAAAISFGVGLVVLLGVTLSRQGLPSAAQWSAVPWWAWTGGALGSFYVWAAIWSVPRIGVVTLAAALILGQIVAALIIDRYGWFGLPVQAFTWQRVGGALLVGAGLILSRL